MKRFAFRIEGRDKAIAENLCYVSITVFGIEIELRVWNWR